MMNHAAVQTCNVVLLTSVILRRTGQRCGKLDSVHRGLLVFVGRITIGPAWRVGLVCPLSSRLDLVVGKING